MRIVNTNFQTITEYDIEKGRLVENKAVREDATPIDDITKFAWEDSDFEDVLMYIPDHVEEIERTPQDDIDMLLIDQEYRLTLLELGITE